MKLCTNTQKQKSIKDKYALSMASNIKSSETLGLPYGLFSGAA